MNIKTQQRIRVYNYTRNKVCLNTVAGKEYVFEPFDGENPVMEYMTWDEIEWLNNRGEIFRSGTLRFNPDDEAEIFEALGCPDYRDAMFTEERIQELLTNPTSENVATIIGITSAATIERVRGTMYKLLSVGGNVSAKVEDVVNARAVELRDGKIKSSMSIRKHEAPAPDTGAQAAIAELQAQLKAMQEQLNAKSEPAPKAEPKKTVPTPKRKPASGSKSTPSNKK